MIANHESKGRPAAVPRQKERDVNDWYFADDTKADEGRRVIFDEGRITPRPRRAAAGGRDKVRGN